MMISRNMPLVGVFAANLCPNSNYLRKVVCVRLTTSEHVARSILTDSGKDTYLNLKPLCLPFFVDVGTTQNEK